MIFFKCYFIRQLGLIILQVGFYLYQLVTAFNEIINEQNRTLHLPTVSISHYCAFLWSRANFKKNYDFKKNVFNPRAFCQNRIFLDILEIFRLDMGQISSNLFKKAFAT